MAAGNSGALDNIQHIVVLMLENRSFDSLLGKLYPKTAGFNGLAGSESNLVNGLPVTVWNSPGTDVATMSIPTPDPGELYTDITTQLFGTNQPTSGSAADMSGFARNYATQGSPGAPPGTYDPAAVMHFFSSEQVPVISQLARQFAVCDQWHASAPCQTWPNRFFVHTGTANGYENNSPTHFPYEMPTIFTRFGSPSQWRIYFHDMPQTLTLSNLWGHLDNFRLYAEFQRDASEGTLPSYSFIEPRYFPGIDQLPNDQHPPHVVSLGEQLIADVYNCLRGGPAWTQTLLIIVYDEHGGCFDHVAPPAAVEPTPPNPGQTFNFDRYGVRIPAVIVSPYIRQGTVFRTAASQPPLDHTSIIATLRQRFSLGPALSQRDARAPDLSGALTLPTPDNLGPPSLQALPFVPSPADLARARLAPVNDLQEALTRLAAHLPDLAATGNTPAAVQAHIAALRLSPGMAPPAGVLATKGKAASYIKERLEALFSGI